MEIKTVSIIGLGALGTMYAERFSAALPRGAVRVVVSDERRERYEQSGVFCNGARCDFFYVSPAERSLPPADLVLFCVKAHNLKAAMDDCAAQIGEHTLILSAINGITSEEILGRRFGPAHIVHCIAQGTDATRDGGALTYQNIGKLCVGEKGGNTEKTAAITAFFEKVNMPYETPDDIIYRLWSKFMMNCGVNQATAVFKTGYGGLSRPGRPRDTMIAAMREVMAISKPAGIRLTEEDLTYWLDIVAALAPDGMPSMLQDVTARRKTEVELFSGTVVPLGKKYGIKTPVNEWLYIQLISLEREFGVRI